MWYDTDVIPGIFFGHLKILCAGLFTKLELNQTEEIMEECEEGAMCDAGIISAGQKIEHYEIATYGTLSQFAETLGLTKAVKLLEATLKEEKAADEKLSEVATEAINIEAAKIEA